MTQLSDDNYFDIPNAEYVVCSLTYYQIGHSHLIISTIHPPDTGLAYVLRFSGVEYLECPIHWYGANFRLVDPTDRLKHLQEMRYVDDLSKLKLFEASIKPFGSYDPEENFDKYKVRILALSGSKSATKNMLGTVR